MDLAPKGEPFRVQGRRQLRLASIRLFAHEDVLPSPGFRESVRRFVLFFPGDFSKWFGKGPEPGQTIHLSRAHVCSMWWPFGMRKVCLLFGFNPLPPGSESFSRSLDLTLAPARGFVSVNVQLPPVDQLQRGSRRESGQMVERSQGLWGKDPRQEYCSKSCQCGTPASPMLLISGSSVLSNFRRPMITRFLGSRSICMQAGR